MGVFKSKKREGFYYIDGKIYVDGDIVRYSKESITDKNFKSKKWCEEEERRIIKERRKKVNSYDYNKNFTFRDLEDDYLTRRKIDGAKERTIQNLTYRTNNYYDVFFGKDSKIKNVFTERKVEMFKLWLLDKNIKTNYKNEILTTFQQIISFACDRKLISYEEERILLKCAKKFKDWEGRGGERSIYTSPEDAKKVWESASNEIYQNVFHIFYYSGCRISEFLGIEAKDVCFYVENNTLIAKVNINKQVFKQKGETIPYLKNSNSKRDIYFINEVAACLKNYIGKWDLKGRDLIFHFSKTSFRRELNRAFDKANVPHNTFHGFGRKSIATYLYISSGDIKLPQILLGHKEVDMTLNTYVLNQALNNSLIEQLAKIEK